MKALGCDVSTFWWCWLAGLDRAVACGSLRGPFDLRVKRGRPEGGWHGYACGGLDRWSSAGVKLVVCAFSVGLQC